MEPNPVLLFELRQLVRNRTILWLMTAYLAAMTLFFISILIFPQKQVEVTLQPILDVSGLGNQAAIGLLYFFYGFASLALVGFATVRMASDRLSDSPVYYTLLSPWRIVWGKFLFGQVISVLFLSMTLPFGTVAYMLRGVDVLQFTFGLFFLFCLIQIQYFIAVALFSGAKSTPRLVGWSVPFGILQFLLVFFVVTQFSDMIRGIRLDNELIPIFFVTFCIFLVSMTTLILLATVQLAPETSNRMFPIRVAFTSIQVLLLLLFFGRIYWSLFGSMPNRDDLIPFLIPFFLFVFTFPYLFLIFICEREEYSPRIRRQIPNNGWLRLLAFPFFTGAPNAMVWALLTLILEGLTFWCIYLVDVGYLSEKIPNHIYWDMVSGLGFGLLLFDYCGTTLLAYDLFLWRYCSRQWNWTFCFGIVSLLVLFGCCCEFIFGLFGRFPGLEFKDFPFLPIPWAIGDDDFVWKQLTIGGFWTLILMVVGLPCLIRHRKNFRNDSEPH